MKLVTSVRARENFADLLNRTYYAGERVIITRKNKPAAALVPLEDLDFLEKNKGASNEK